MEKSDVLSIKSYDYALRVVKVYKELNSNNHYSLSDQMLRSGTSIAANIRESKFAQSRADFVSKLCISLKEANENDFWIDLLFDSDLISIDSYESLKPLCQEIKYLLIASIKHAERK